MTIREEVVELLQALIRIDTVNPPGNETEAAEALQSYLARNGVVSELLARTPDRANLVARLPGGGGPSLLLMAHTDTVLADPEEWEHDPWSGDLVDGEIWGRGALDMKGHLAVAAVAVIRRPPRGRCSGLSSQTLPAPPLSPAIPPMSAAMSRSPRASTPRLSSPRD